MPACLHSLTHTAPLNHSTIRKASLFSRLLDLASAGPNRCKHGDPSRPKEDREDLLCAIEGSERRRSDLRTGNRVEVGCPAREREWAPPSLSAPGTNTHRLHTTQNQALGHSLDLQQDRLQAEAAQIGFCTHLAGWWCRVFGRWWQVLRRRGERRAGAGAPLRGGGR